MLSILFSQKSKENLIQNTLDSGLIKKFPFFDLSKKEISSFIKRKCIKDLIVSSNEEVWLLGDF